MTTDRERVLNLIREELTMGETPLETVYVIEQARDLITSLLRENEALRKEIDSREAFWAELKRRLPELERENEALRKRLADVGALLAVVGQNHDHN